VVPEVVNDSDLEKYEIEDTQNIEDVWVVALAKAATDRQRDRNEEHFLKHLIQNYDEKEILLQ
jgi:hypothetical protein